MSVLALEEEENSLDAEQLPLSSEIAKVELPLYCTLLLKCVLPAS